MREKKKTGCKKKLGKIFDGAGHDRRSHDNILCSRGEMGWLMVMTPCFILVTGHI